MLEFTFTSIEMLLTVYISDMEGHQPETTTNCSEYCMKTEKKNKIKNQSLNGLIAQMK